VTGRVVVFGPSAPEDDALENSRWIADQHIQRLGGTALPVVDGDATRAGLERALADASVGGVALCGHGDGGKQVFLLDNQHKRPDEKWRRHYDDTSEHGAVYGSDGEAALDHDDLGSMRGRWVHILACLVGRSDLPRRALEQGAVAVAAYDDVIVPEFTVPSLPRPAVTMLGRIATVTTVRMAEHQFDHETLVNEVRYATEDLLEWLDSDEGAAWEANAVFAERIGLTKFAEQLSSALRVHVPTLSLAEV
jgi:hypothetical protein